MQKCDIFQENTIFSHVANECTLAFIVNYVYGQQYLTLPVTSDATDANVTNTIKEWNLNEADATFR